MKDNFYERYEGKARKNIPKYIQLGEVILSAIKEGYWQPGSRLPSEVEITRTTPFSLGTVQKALRMVADQGIIERRHGLGTFVSEGMAAPWHCRFLSESKGFFFPVYPKVVGRKIVTRNDRWATLLSPGGGELIQIDRIINIGHRFSVYNVFYISLEKYPAFWKKPIEEVASANLKIILQKEHNQGVTHASHFLRAVTFKADICRALNLKEGIQGMLLEIVASSGRGNPVYFSEIYVPPIESRLYISDFPSSAEYWL